MRKITALGLALAVLSMQACVIFSSVGSISTSSDSVMKSSDSVSASSDSSKSVSKSLASSSGSISGSSSKSDEEKKQSYRLDVSRLTAIYLEKNKADAIVGAAFQRDLARLALEYGISNFENEDATFVGIGAGLKKMSVEKAQAKHIAARLSAGDKRIEDLILSAFDSV